MEPIIGTICLFAGNFAPKGWMPCEGQCLHPQQYQALFHIIGTTYGGNGRSSFHLPDLRVGAAKGCDTGLGSKEEYLALLASHGSNAHHAICMTYMIAVDGIFLQEA